MPSSGSSGRGRRRPGDQRLAFLALSCSELTTIDLRYFEGDLLDTIAGLEPDIALTLYAASTTRLDNLFQYEHTEE